MPIYDYKCDDCEELFTEMHSMNDKIDSCRFCNSESVHKTVMKFAAKTENTLDQAERKLEERASKDRKRYAEDDKFAANITGADDPNHEKKLQKQLSKQQKKNDAARDKIKRVKQ